MKSIFILGIETSCDETAAAVVENGRVVHSNVVVSSLKEHKKHGGIIPEIASRQQLEFIDQIVEQALEGANLKISDVSAIAVTHSPGLIGSLLVGISFAQALSFAAKKPLIEVDHIQAHLYANFLKLGNEKFSEPKLPAIGLVVSGGHSSLYLVKSFHEVSLIGQTRDDAAGEAFDKVARLLGLGYPGGPVIDRLAQEGSHSRLQFACAQLPDSLDFSFSGIKTAVLYYQRKHNPQEDLPVKEIAFSFQDSIVKTLVKKCLLACEKHKVKTLLIGGGVACNSSLRMSLQDNCRREGIAVFFPPLSLCTDNAAMIAGLGFHLRKRKLSNKMR